MSTEQPEVAAPSRLEWLPCIGGFDAMCGEERQGITRVGLFDDGWRWWVDMLPYDAEPVIFGGSALANHEAAQREAERQVAEWPALVPGAVRQS